MSSINNIKNDNNDINTNSKFLDSKSVNTVLNSIFDLGKYNKKCIHESSGGDGINAEIK